jgi:predicted ester cyclase
MNVPWPVEAFYRRIWNEGNLEAISDLLTDDFTFRGSLGMELQGREAFREYVLSVRDALADYRCEILACVTEGPHAFAKMRFGGIHVGQFRGFSPTGKPVQWLGAALFRFSETGISEVWVLGDLTGLDALLKENQEALRC